MSLPLFTYLSVSVMESITSDMFQGVLYVIHFNVCVH